MICTQIYLTEQECQDLGLISQKVGKSQSALIREAIDEFVKANLKERESYRNALQAAKDL